MDASKTGQQIHWTDIICSSVYATLKDILETLAHCCNTNTANVRLESWNSKDKQIIEIRELTLVERNTFIKTIIMSFIQDQLCGDNDRRKLYSLGWSSPFYATAESTNTCRNISTIRNRKPHINKRTQSSEIGITEIAIKKHFNYDMDRQYGRKVISEKTLWKNRETVTNNKTNIYLDEQQTNRANGNTLRSQYKELGRQVDQSFHPRSQQLQESFTVDKQGFKNSGLGLNKRIDVGAQSGAGIRRYFQRWEEQRTATILSKSTNKMGLFSGRVHRLDTKPQRKYGLWSPTFSSTTQVCNTRHTMEISNNMCATNMDKPHSLAINPANYRGNPSGSNTSSRATRSNTLRNQKKQTLVSNSQKNQRSSLQRIRNELLTRSYANSTLKQYSTLWKQFKLFCWGDVKSNLTTTSVLDFLTFIFQQGKGYAINSAWAAIRFYSLKLNWSIARINLATIRKYSEAMTLVYNREFKQHRKRDPFDVDILLKFSKCMNKTSFEDTRALVLIAVATRCILRPIEISRLRINDVKLLPQSEQIEITPQRAKISRKDSQKPEPIPIEKSLGSVCLVELMPNYLKRLADWYKAHKIKFSTHLPLFPWIYPKKGIHTVDRLKINAIIQYMKKCVINKYPELREKLSNMVLLPHSIRGGSATRLSAAGAPLDLIKNGGNWTQTSSAVFKYIRNHGSMAARFSNKLFGG